jgi:hypothetical protein
MHIFVKIQGNNVHIFVKIQGNNGVWWTVYGVWCTVYGIYVLGRYFARRADNCLATIFISFAIAKNCS